MSDWPSLPIYPNVVVNSLSGEATGLMTGGLGLNIAQATSLAWAAASAAVFVPFRLYQQVTLTQGFIYNGATASGNADIGIYLPNGARVVSMGSTAQSGTSALQTLNITDTTLGPGLFYMAMALDNGTGTVFHLNLTNAGRGSAAGCYTMTSAFALPNPATFATFATFTRLPLFGFTTRAVV